MTRNLIRSFLFGANHLAVRGNNEVKRVMRFAHRNSHGEESPEEEEQEEEGQGVLPSEWYATALSKMKKWSHSMKDLDLVGGRLVNIHNHSRIFDAQLEHKMHTYKSTARVLIGHPSVLETTRQTLIASNPHYSTFQLFNRHHQREALTVSSLTRVSDILNISAQQRKIVRHTICPQVTQHSVWTGALVEILCGLKSDVEVLIGHKPSKEMRLAQQILVGCLNLLEPCVSYDPEKSSWMRLAPTRDVNSNTNNNTNNSADSPKWEDVLEMSVDLINCLSEETHLTVPVLKLEAMKEGLYQIRDVVIDKKKMGYKEARYQEHLVQKKLSKTLGHSSRCLFTLLVYYLYGTVKDIDVEVRGGLQVVGSGNRSCLHMGKILTVDEEKVVWNGVRQLDRALRLFKFVWESAGMKGDLELRGHLWHVGGGQGGSSRSFTYRGNIYFLHAMGWD
ncbi:uncharacterized protein LOC127265441 [Andrographis paniculata]|uniref:uncharacterized protein LOC127265441 n=1 Tax=Andrographis paniculata TaxID=175694 RepID=UPI0021E98BF3|nr:uncharacterized protein LOC127265441 [Andrographis paniculata]